jgi:integrase/recombinase XerC
MNDHIMENQLVKAFTDYLAVVKGRSAHTVKAYGRDVTDFVDFMLESHGSFDPAEVDKRDIRAFLFRQRSTGRNVTLSRKLSSLRTFFRFLVREGRLKHNPAYGVEPPKFVRRQPLFLDVDEAFALMVAPDSEDPVGIRDRAALELLYSSGLRIGELVGLDIKDVDPAQGLVRVMGKGSKERIVPVGSKALEALQAYLAIRPGFFGSKADSLNT